MERPSLGIITKEKKTMDFIVNELEDIFRDNVTLEPINLDDAHSENTILQSQVILVTGDETLKECTKKGVIYPHAKIIFAKQTLNINKVDGLIELLNLPIGTDVLVADNRRANNFEHVYQIIDSIQNLGLDHINLIPLAPNDLSAYQINTAITFGMPEFVPDNIENVIDLGVRQLDLETIISIVKALQLKDVPVYKSSFPYIKSLVTLTRNIVNSSNEIINMNKKLQGVIETSNEGLIVLNNKMEVIITNENGVRFLEMDRKELIGKKIIDIISNLDVIKLKNGKSQIITINNNNLMATINKLGSNNLGFVVILRKVSVIQNIEKEARRYIYNKQYVAKYNFSDIVTKNPKMNELKTYAKQIAKNDFDVLIYGDSGTGKELFAQAIHNNSNRKKNPFVAANVAAFSDNLIESELFGYEEGAL
ncbi:hypothetical protein GCM10008931_15520 [Oceanobacillus oncorhynchi subsp. oncorhynchi]|uniref:sigma 54-interacting transcriptional regulator n=1 Tax=Oceanobacillus oncorhynchi TaxID=545501 RepID=UPI0031D90EE6